MTPCPSSSKYQGQDNVTEWDIRSWCWRPGFPVGQHYKVAIAALSQISTSPDMTLNVAKMEVPQTNYKGQWLFNT